MSLLKPDTKVDKWAGARIGAQGTEEDIKVITLKEFQKLDLKISKEGKATYKQTFLLKAKPSDVGITAEGVEGPAKIK